MPSVFVSYRRADAPAHAGRLYDALAARFGAENVFKDLDSMDAGVDFVEAIETAIARADVLLAVIGREWLSTRLDDPRDWVRLEISRALERDVRVVPVLVGGASMPAAERLSDDLKPLCRCHAVALSEFAWTAQISALIESLSRSMPGWRSMAETDLGLAESLADAGDSAGARAALQRVIDSGDPDRACEARLHLGDLLVGDDDLESARELYQEALDLGPTKYRDRARCSLGAILREQGDPDGAVAAFRLCIHSDDRAAASFAWWGLAEIAVAGGDHRTALKAYDQVLEIAHPDWVGVAAIGFADVLESMGDVTRARTVYQRAIRMGPEYISHEAGYRLGQLCAGDGDLTGARASYERVADSDDPTWAPRARAALAALANWG